MILENNNFIKVLDLETDAESIIEKYFLVLQDYINDLGDNLNDTPNTYLNSLSSEQIKNLQEQLSSLLDLFIEWDIWSLYDKTLDIIKKIKNTVK